MCDLYKPMFTAIPPRPPKPTPADAGPDTTIDGAGAGT